MVLSRRFVVVVVAASTVIAASSACFPAAAAEVQPARAGEVSLSLKDYLTLKDSAERADTQRQAAAHREAPVAAVAAQHTAVDVGRAGGTTAAPGGARAALAARFSSQLEVLVQGRPQQPIALPSAGLVSAVEVLPAGSGATAAGAGPHGPGLFLVAPEAGRYGVRVRSEERVVDDFGVSRVALPPILAPVAAMDVTLPADLAWECAGMVVIEDRVDGGSRRLRLSGPRGLEPVLVLRQAVAGDQAAELLVQDVAATLLQLRPEGLRRQDVILYEVKRGGLADLVVDLPPGLEVERAATDEGLVTAVAEGRRLTVHRRQRLTGSGYLVLTSRPPGGPGLLPLAAVAPQPAPRARYLAVAATVPGRLAPQPAAAWTRVDLDDLPAPLQGALTALDSTSAWRQAADGRDAAAVEWSTTPQASSLETVVQRRQTTTLLSADGTLLHRDSFELAQAGAVLSLDLPAGATLWSAAIDGTAVRPLQRGSRLDVPLGGGARVVEVVEVLPRAIAAGGRSRLSFELAQVAAPVVEHRWRLLLPASARYRFAGGSLQPIPAPQPAAADMAVRAKVRWLGPVPTARDPWVILQSTPGVMTDRVNRGGNESGQNSAYVRPASGASAALQGQVTDPGGTPLPGVDISLAPVEQQGQKLTQVSGPDGRFAFTGVSAGQYHLKAQLDGFAVTEVPNVRLDAGAAQAVELVLSNTTEEVITVTSEAPLLDERRLSTGATVSTADMRQVPTARAPAAPAPASPQLLDELHNGLAGGVRPLPISVPESGKALLLAGVLPPARVTLELEVKADRRHGD